MSARPHRDARVARVVEFFEALAPGHTQRLHEVYTEDARFKDPFNEIQGLGPLAAVFDHMFRTLKRPRFVIRAIVAEGDEAFVTWDFFFSQPRIARGAEQTVRGATHLVFAPDGRIALHRDYWDAAEELYEKLPLVGSLMRWLKRRASG